MSLQEWPAFGCHTLLASLSIKEAHNSKNSKCDIFAVAHLCEHRLYYVTVSGEQSPPEDPVSRYLEIPWHIEYAKQTAAALHHSNSFRVHQFFANAYTTTQGITVCDNLCWLPNRNSMMHCSLDMQPKHAARTCKTMMHCSLDMQPKHAAWTCKAMMHCSLDMQFEHANDYDYAYDFLLSGSCRPDRYSPYWGLNCFVWFCSISFWL